MSADETPDEETAYATRVEDAFIAERGTPFLLSPKDWKLIQGWRAAGVPVDTVVRAVREAFERRRARGAAGKINSLSYCQGAVEERWEMERRGLAGSGEGSRDLPAEETARRLARLREALASSATAAPEGVDPERYQKALAKASEKLASLDPAGGFETLEEKLHAAESSLARALLPAIDEPSRAAVEEAVSSALGDVSAAREEVVARMRRALTRRELRRRLGLPPLTLFDA